MTENWLQWSIPTLIALGSLIVAYFSFRKKPDTSQKQIISKSNLQQSPTAQNIGTQVNHFNPESKSEAPKNKTEPEEIISEKDKQVIYHLFSEVLDLDMAQDVLEIQQTWYGYKKVAINNLLNFTNEADKLSNRISNKAIRLKIETFLEHLDQFNRDCSKAVSQYHLDDWYLYIGRQEDSSSERKELELEKAEEIDKVGMIAYEKLTELTDLLRQKELL